MLANKVGETCCQARDNSTILLGEEKQPFVFDYVFGSDSTQTDVYEKVGKETIADVMDGYNGTVLAYGQTGSGKTFTMFGSDVYDESGKGLIPRMALEIFHAWDYNPDVKELGVNCSMLEIYKENLKDLLNEDSGDELKIKESPQRGIYVEGLSSMPLGSEDELMYWIGLGEARRAWAETRQNSVSSRSHTLLILEVKQTLANDSEVRGILNLVDLAGCEKVGRSGAHGKIFDEGTKINLSLSALGNVIHALTSGLEHIPYRDSKLTRLLQESLGGNYKTTLIVTCSPHSSQIQETQSSLKFAQRAKKIKNRVQINVKSSPDQLLKIIDQLREELRVKTAQLEQFMSSPGASLLKLADSTRPTPQSLRLPSLPLAQIEEKDVQNSPKIDLDLRHCRSSSASSIPDFAIKEDLQIRKKEENIMDMSYDALETKLAEAMKGKEKMMASMGEMKTRMETMRKENVDLEARLRQAEVKLLEEKKRVLVVEDKLKKTEIELHQTQYEKLKKDSEEKLADVQKRVNENQIRALTEALDDAETECFKLLKDKKCRTQADSVDFCSLTLADYITKNIVPRTCNVVRRSTITHG